ncbi:MAG: hypothetical protein HY591_06320 [Candidatus Omnitrophica bacterium]|nr:hypothetical protein [Candidatus Omnitrophota bacterium]
MGEYQRLNIALISWLVIVEVVQAVIYAHRIFGYKPAHELPVYILMIAAAVAAQAWWLVWGRKRRMDCGFVLSETVLTALQLCALWQMLIYSHRPQLAQYALNVLLMLSVLNKIFWPQVRRFMSACLYAFTNPVWIMALRPWADAACAVFIAALIYVPDPEAAVAKMFMGEHFHHYDMMVVAPAFACLKGLLLYIDTFTTYGFGMPFIVAWLAERVGGFSDLTVFKMIVVLCMAAYVSYYIFLRYLFKSVVLSMAAIFMGIKWQMFYTFAYPMTFTYANSTALRFGTDSLFLLMIILHMRAHRRGFLWMAAACAGFAAFFIISTGVDLIFAFWAYLTLHLIVKEYRPYVVGQKLNLWKVAGLYAAPLVCAFAFYASVAGQYAFGKLFWHNMSEAQRLFLDGFVYSPYFNGWRHGEYLNDWMGLALPTVLLGTMVFIVINALTGRGRYEAMFFLVMSVYGYSMYAHFAALCVGNNYYMRALPFVFVCFYWIKQGIDRLPEAWRPRAALGVLALSAFALFSNHNYISHPNIFNFSRNPMVDPLVAEPLPDGRPYFFHQEATTESFLLPVNSLGEKDQGFVYEYQFPDHESLKAYYRKESDFSREGNFIAGLTSPDEPVALLCSYDWRILHAANRKPLFYTTPMFGNRPLRARTLADSSIYHKDFLKRELDLLETRKPGLIFIQKIYLTTTDPKEYFKDANTKGLIFLLDYIRRHYEPFKEDGHLAALKRKD